MRPVLAGVLLCVLGVTQRTATIQTVAPAVTFHHFHYRVGEPAAAMNRGASALNGTRVLLRGLGVGVRVGAVHALFDRADGSSAVAPVAPDDAYASALSWLRTHGMEIREDAASSASRAALGEMFRSEVLDHVGFTAADMPAAIAALRAHSAAPRRETADGAVFQPAGGLPIEILRDLDAPDAYWCPMHPDVRSSTSGTCPICRMNLVLMPPLRLGEYRMDVAMAASGDGISGLRITLHEPDTDRRVTSLATIHERLVHLFIIDRRLEFFRHLHPERAGDGVFELREPIPAGEYVIVADFLPQAGAAQMVHRAIVTPGYQGPLFPAPPDLSTDLARERTIDGIRLQLDAQNLKAGREAVLRFTLSDAASGAPITDLEPLLGAPGHVLIVNADLTEADHVHPEEPVARGPAITFQPLLPAGGFYKLWLQFQRRGVVTTVPFVVSVDER